jgi:hypothetical protein
MEELWLFVVIGEEENGENECNWNSNLRFFQVMDNNAVVVHLKRWTTTLAILLSAQ